MTPRRLDWALRLHGTDLAAWPADQRVAALSLMRRCKQARRIMADALAQEDLPPADGYLTDPPAGDAALLASMQCRLVRRLVARSPAVPAIRCGAFVACALAGLYLGTADLDPERPDLFAAVQVIAIDAAL